MTTRRKFLQGAALASAGIILPSCDYISKLSSKWNKGTNTSIPLNGRWRFRLDPENTGLQEGWQNAIFVEAALLPGSLQSQDYGNDVTADTDWWDGKLEGVWKTSPLYAKYRKPGDVKIYEFLQPTKHYLGAAWYSRIFKLPESWKDKRIILVLERVHWESTVFINGKKAGSQNYLGTAHEYDLTSFAVAGENQLTIRIDNSRKIDIGDMPHSISEQTQGTWNGIAGEIALTTTDKVWIDDIQVFPDITSRRITAGCAFGNLLDTPVRGTLEIGVTGPRGAAHRDPMKDPDKKRGKRLPVLEKEISVPPGGCLLQLDYSLGDDLALWDEHHPSLYTLSATFSGKSSSGEAEKPGRAGRSHKYADVKTVTFGMREVTSAGTQVAINSKAIHIRGNVDCAIFPVDGWPYMDIDWWKRLWLLYKEWGMNLVRFHSWCPPEAAFTAADEVGIYLQPECSEWASDYSDAQFGFLARESAAILKRYGNHPSFIMMALGNEKSIKTEYLEKLFDAWKKDKRRLYTGKTGGKPLLEAADYYAGGASRNGAQARYYLSWPPRPEPSFFYKFQPSTTRDYTPAVKDDPRPFISHEIAQRCSYPDVINLPEKFTGSLRPTYLDIARDQLEERGMLDQVPDFVNASGRWQVEMYKEEIEANLRTPGIGGFHLLSLQDFPGQGTAPVGFMDFFYDVKPYVTSSRMKNFCHHTVILARLKKRTWFSNEQLEANIELYNFSGKSFHPSRAVCTIRSADGEIIQQAELPVREYPDGTVRPAGKFSADLGSFTAPAKYTIEISMDEVTNDWDFWVYPQNLPSINTPDILVSETFDKEVRTALDHGRTVLLTPGRDQLKGKLVQCFGTFYWTAFDFHGGETSACGLLTDPKHPVFKHFPTDFHGNWQWWELLVRAAPMILDDFSAQNPFPKNYRPLIQMIPSWKVNRKLSVLTEVKAGKGKLMLCSMDISSDPDRRKVAAQFRYSLLNYLMSEEFSPDTEVSYDTLGELFQD